MVLNFCGNGFQVMWVYEDMKKPTSEQGPVTGWEHIQTARKIIGMPKKGYKLPFFEFAAEDQP